MEIKVYVESSNPGDFGVGNQIRVTMDTATGDAITTNATISGGTDTAISATKYDVKLIHAATNAMILDQVIEVR